MMPLHSTLSLCGKTSEYSNQSPIFLLSEHDHLKLTNMDRKVLIPTL
jgi:hypothetical protein